MREYDILRLAVPVMHGMLGEVDYTHEGLLAFEERAGEAIDRTLASRPPIELFGRYWCDQVERGLPALESVERSDVLEVRFEELVDDPAVEMRRIAEFFEIGDLGDGWIERACALVRGRPPTRLGDLSADERAALEEACRPGIELERRFVASLAGER